MSSRAKCIIQNIYFSYKSVVTTSIAEFDLVKKKYSKNNIALYLRNNYQTAKFSYSSIKPKLLPCATACGCKFHALAVYLHLTFTAPFQLEVHLESSQKCAVKVCSFSQKQSAPLGHWLFLLMRSIVDVWQNSR